MRAELHIVQGADIDIAAWRAAFDAIGLEVMFPEGFELPSSEGARSDTIRFRIADAGKWPLGEAIVAGDHAIEVRRRGCLLCELHPGSERTRDEIVVSGSGVAAWLCAGTFSFASDRAIVDRIGRRRVASDDALFVAKRAARAAALKGSRSFVHADGRKVEVGIEANALVTTILLPDDPESISRRRPLAELAGYIDELVADGFAETTENRDVPELDVIEEMVSVWRRDDPTFDVDTLAAPLRGAEGHAQIAEALTALEIVWVRQPDGTSCSDNEATEKNRARAREVLVREDAAVDAALLLALRPNEPFGRAHAARDLLQRRRLVPPAMAFPALLACIRAFRSSRNDLPGDAAEVLQRYRPLPDALTEPLLVLLEDPRWETAAAAAALLAGRASERRFFDALWAHRSDEGDPMMHAVLNACEAQRDRSTIPWLEALYKRRGMGADWKERVDAAIATVRG
jgi:hypothetical protein